MPYRPFIYHFVENTCHRVFNSSLAAHVCYLKVRIICKRVDLLSSVYIITHVLNSLSFQAYRKTNIRVDKVREPCCVALNPKEGQVNVVCNEKEVDVSWNFNRLANNRVRLQPNERSTTSDRWWFLSIRRWGLYRIQKVTYFTYI